VTRGTTYDLSQRKGAHNPEGEAILCGWDQCEKDGLMLYSVRQNNAKPGFPDQFNWFLFCTERHRQYFLAAPNPKYLYGRLPEGMHGII
jgi:hypothetical protein